MIKKNNKKFRKMFIVADLVSLTTAHVLHAPIEEVLT